MIGLVRRCRVLMTDFIDVIRISLRLVGSYRLLR